MPHFSVIVSFSAVLASAQPTSEEESAMMEKKYGRMGKQKKGGPMARLAGKKVRPYPSAPNTNNHCHAQPTRGEDTAAAACAHRSARCVLTHWGSLSCTGRHCVDPSTPALSSRRAYVGDGHSIGRTKTLLRAFFDEKNSLKWITELRD